MTHLGRPRDDNGHPVVLLVGPPGSGKGTQAVSVCRALGITHVSTGDMLRAEVEIDSPLGRMVRPVMEAGALVSDALIVDVVGAWLQRNPTAGVLLDGFPRTVDQARILDRMLADEERSVGLVVCLDVPRDALVRRLIRRADVQGRKDDNAAAIEQRINVYVACTDPIIEHYERSGVDVSVVDGSGTVAEVQGRVLASVDVMAAWA